MFTPEQRSRCAIALNYPIVTRRASLRVGGNLAPTALMNSLNVALDAVAPSAERLVMAQVARVECIQAQIDEARKQVQLLGVEKVKFNENGVFILRNEMATEQQRLADMLCIRRYPTAYGTMNSEGGLVEPC